MPIEDIDFLYQNSIKENIILLIDSAKRDKLIYPNASEFQINFIEPFHFVYGIEVLDTTIPRTMFMIEEYNNKLTYRYGFEMLSHNSNTEFRLIEQDFSSAEVFFQRFNEQLVSKNISFEVDNYDNVFDNSLNEQRKKSDYPVTRFINPYPFFLDITNSTIYNVLGFDQFPKPYESQKYLVLNDVINSYTPFIKQEPYLVKNTFAYTDIIPFSVRTETSSFNIDPESNYYDSLNTFRFTYKHSQEYSLGSFLNYIKLDLTKTNIYEDNVSIKISLYNKTTDKLLFSNLTNDIFNKTISTVSFPYNETSNFFQTIPNTYFILNNHHIYEVVIENVFIPGHDQNTFRFNIQLGYSYFVDLTNLDISNTKLFFSKPIYDVNETTTSIYVSNDTTEFLPTDLFVPYSFDLDLFDTSNKLDFFNGVFAIYPTFSVKNISIKVKTDLNIDQNDIFFLTLTRINKTTLEESFLGCLYMTYQDINGDSFLISNNDNINTSVLSYIHFGISNDPEDPHYIENVKINFKLTCCTKTVNLIGDAVNGLNYDLTFVFFKEFGLLSPGMLNLASENYIILRCEEIENHLRGSYDVKDNSPGLGVLNIDVQGYASGRTEFFSVNYKEFHPIGKLNKLKFRFERKSDGELYNFKNVDLHFIMTIKFLRPKQKQTFEKSILNPNYNPNYLGYFNKTLQDQYDDSSNDESDIDDQYFENEFNDIENRMIHRSNRHYHT